MSNNLTSEEFYKYCVELDNFSSMFYEIWRMGIPQFSDKIKTAAVTFNKDGKYIEFLFNKAFWNSLNEYERLFVICHESLHIFLNHGIRTKDYKNKRLANVALDIVVNQLLLKSFGFNEESLPNLNGKNICTVKTVFGKNSGIKTDGCFEYYLSILNDISEEVSELLDSLDDHSYLEPIDEEDLGEIKDIIAESMGETLEKKIAKNIDETHCEKENSYSHQKAGSGSSDRWVISKVKYNPKRKWETVIKNWSKKGVDDKLTDQWIKENRRFATMKNNFFMPTEGEIEDYEKTKIDTWFFQDTSGSCSGFIDRFFRAAKSLPRDRFDIKMHCFDTRVFETTLESGKLYGFGGTSFSILESYIQSYMVKNRVPYPKAVFVITDGYGDNINPQYPARWHWFLSTNYTSLINKDCKIYKLEDYE